MDRQDGLPHPATVGELYLAAVLDEVRGLRANLRSLAPEPVKDGTVALVENKKKGK